MEAGVLPTRNGGQKGLFAQEPHRALLGINSSVIIIVNTYIVYYVLDIVLGSLDKRTY